MRFSRTALGVAASLLLWHGTATAEPLKLRIAWITVPTSLAPILFAKPELARHLGTSYTVEALRFSGSSQMTTALASGDLDIAERAIPLSPMPCATRTWTIFASLPTRSRTASATITRRNTRC